jgi:hypothetical protein
MAEMIPIEWAIISRIVLYISAATMFVSMIYLVILTINFSQASILQKASLGDSIILTATILALSIIFTMISLDRFLSCKESLKKNVGE